MKKWVLPLMFVSISAWAEPDKQPEYKQVFCDTKNNVYGALWKNIGGRVLFIATSDKLKLSTVFIHNKETGNWAIVDVKGEDACIIGVGDKVKYNLDFFNGEIKS